MSRTASRVGSRIGSRIARRTALGVLLVAAVAACAGEGESGNEPDGRDVPPTIEAELAPVTATRPSARTRAAAETDAAARTHAAAETRAAFAARRVSSPSVEPSDESVRAIPAGTLLTFEAREDVSTSSHAAGDIFALVLVDPVRGPAEAYMAKGSPARGIVTDARSGTGADGPALLAVHVVSVQADGRQVHLDGTIRSAAIEDDARAGEATLAMGSRIVLRLGRDLVY